MVFQDTFPLVVPYLDFVSAGLDPEMYRGGCWSLADPESAANAEAAWADIREKLDSFHQLATVLESYAPIDPEQEPLYRDFQVSPEGKTLRLCP